MSKKPSPAFKSWRSFYDFARAVRYESRYVHGNEVNAFLETLWFTARKRIAKIPADSVLWRAQLGSSYFEFDDDGNLVEEECSLPLKRMKPEKDRAREGRANPKGIPYLYLADDRDTAMAEVRPWNGSSISTGQFRILKDLTVLDCSSDTEGFIIYLEEPTPTKRGECVWRDVNAAFARPVTASDQDPDYVATQIIAEYFKMKNVDGIVYKSSCGEGHNVVLFDLDAAEILNCTLFTTTGVKFSFRQCAETCFSPKHRGK